MKKSPPLSLRTLLTTAVVATVASTALAFSSPATIKIDGRSVKSDVPPVVTSNRQAYLPLRVVTAHMGARVSYDKKTRGILVVRGSDRLKLRLGRTTAVYNGKPVRLSHAPFAVRGRTMVAAKTLERTLGPKVEYNPRKSTIDVVTTDTSGASEGAETINTAF